MKRTDYYFYCLVISLMLSSTITYSQNFDETWKEFLDNNKISNMSELIRPDKKFDKPNYAKYLLMNTNSSFCQSDVDDAERLMLEIGEIDARVHQSIDGFVKKYEDLDTKIKAYHSIDAIWLRFLETKEVDPEELDDVKGAKTLCEKSTLAKYSYMLAYYNLCQGEVSKSKFIIKNRTLRLAQKTSWRIKHVKGLAPELKKMISLFEELPKLDTAWNTYVKTGVSQGFDLELPLFPCYPIPNMKALVLRGAADVCNKGPAMLEKIKALQADSGVVPDEELASKIRELDSAVDTYDSNLAKLNEAWEAFLPDNKVKHMGQYGYEFCTKEPLIRAYVMDGFFFVCSRAEQALQKIDSMQMAETTDLEESTIIKINELAELNYQYQSNGIEIEQIWNRFIAQGDTLYQDYQSGELYCDHILEVKDWTMRGHSGNCEESLYYLEKIEEFSRTFEFKFYKELECRVNNLRVKIWDCRYTALVELAQIKASPESYEEALEELMHEYGMGERPLVCSLDEE